MNYNIDIEEYNMIIEDLPEYIKKHATYYRHGIKIVFPWGYLIEDEDVAEMPKAKKWIKKHKGFYNDRGYWFIER